MALCCQGNSRTQAAAKALVGKMEMTSLSIWLEVLLTLRSACRFFGARRAVRKQLHWNFTKLRPSAGPPEGEERENWSVVNFISCLSWNGCVWKWLIHVDTSQNGHLMPENDDQSTIKKKMGGSPLATQNDHGIPWYHGHVWGNSVPSAKKSSNMSPCSWRPLGHSPWSATSTGRLDDFSCGISGGWRSKRT